ncbi:hypothetical protein BWI97_13970 [Siphonobacter sp. BAB-5405]|uniref:hypothetical protein n=1 Tax=Siphonobacter sp. BAB-5405 TaxID=1864825 RepID=UPI000C80CE47|nr:hypothetical protein [Siphonobacter sp. BAB-5405]PMD95702.1 hypothetical protein BWI97_13970 [Siphonobacter sp. BAB-5405]
MKKNLYYRSVFKRTSNAKGGILVVILLFSSWPRLLLEVFLRRNMGERYFSFSTALSITVALSLIPPLFALISSNVIPNYGFVFFLLTYGTWYVFLGFFVFMAIQRREEIKRLPSVFDFARFSLSTGQAHPFFIKFKWRGRSGDRRTIETLLEPGFCFLVGLVLWFLAQYIGAVIMISSVMYGLSYRALYRQGDHFIMDKIDERISNEELTKAFVEGRPMDETRGFPFYGRGPTDPDMRRELASSFMVDDEVVDVS